ncbi:NAD(P)H-dependent flavin oxidoreductase [Ramlibacter sp.]|uniref:NAD(P)H-dependent flavin oxidoreductase n=1 Tax=Ramlibacter sp. TaxID=1917967 RepID=UPI003D10CBE9
MKSIRTPLCDLFDIQVPILQAGMGGVAYGRLAAAVSNAGGLGCIAAIDGTPETVEEEIRRFRQLSNKPLCVDIGFPRRAPTGLADVEVVDLPGPIKQLHKELKALGVEVKPSHDQAMSIEDAKLKLDIALSYGAEAIACALGTPKWVVDTCHAKGTKVIGLVGRSRHVRSVMEAGADAVVVQGTEGGGHTGDVGLLALLAETLSFTTIPVIAAGGIVNGAQIAAVLTQGAQGVWLGTRFLASEESSAEDNFKAAVVEAGHDATVRTPIFDGLHIRSLRNRFIDAWDGHENEMLGYPRQRLVTSPVRWAASRANLKDYMNMPAGQGVGLVNERESAAKILAQLVDETVAALESARERIRIGG